MSAGTDQTQQPTILLVEDEAIIALAERATLERHGYGVTVAGSGQAAINAFKEDPEIDLVLMDIDLGAGIDGTVAAQAILADRDVPVVFLSSHTEPDVVEKTEKITSYGYIVKSSGETVLLASIRMAFRLFEARVNERQALQRLTHSQDLMRYIVGHARSAIAVHDRNLNYLYVSEEYLRTYDVESTDVIGRHHYEVFPDLPQKWRDVHQKALRGEISSAEDDPFDRASGERLWTRWECRPWYENDQSIGGIIINTEVTNRVQRLQKTLADNRNLLAVVMATVPDGLAVIDGHGRFLEVNEALPRMTGYDAGELRSMSVWDLDELDSEEDANRRMMSIRSESHQSFESRLKRKDGASVNVRVSVSLLESEPQSFIAVFRTTDPA